MASQLAGIWPRCAIRADLPEVSACELALDVSIHALLLEVVFQPLSDVHACVLLLG